MRTLYERLKQEHKDALNKEAETYPATAVSVFNELNRKYLILDIKYGCACCLSSTLKLPDTNIDTIMNLFEANELLNVNSK